MDPTIFLVMSAAKQQMDLQQVHADNMANINVVGFKASRTSTQPLYIKGDKVSEKAYAEVSSHSPSMKDGVLNYTGRSLDIALRGNSWVAVSTPNGEVGFAHSASLTRNIGGYLTTEMGYPLSNFDGEAVSIPPQNEIMLTETGEIFERDPNLGLSLYSEIPVYQLDYDKVRRGERGLITIDDAAGVVRLEASGVRIITGALEKANVNSPGVLADMMLTEQNYNANMNSFKTYKEISSLETQTLLR